MKPIVSRALAWKVLFEDATSWVIERRSRSRLEAGRRVFLRQGSERKHTEVDQDRTG